MKMFREEIASLSGLRGAAEKLLNHFPDHKVFAIYGKMGAGKTTFIQAICRSLGSVDNVTSPTFAIINEYNSADLSSIFHFDFYRIENIEEAFDLGYEDYIYSGHYCFIEWPEMIEELLPQDIVVIRIEALEDESRVITAKTN